MIRTGSPLAPLCDLWLKKIKGADRHRDRTFWKVADECWRFFDRAHDWMYDEGSSSGNFGTGLDIHGDAPHVKFRFTMNKVAELVDLFGPVMYHTNPWRQVNPRKPQFDSPIMQMLMPQEQAMAAMQEMQLREQFDGARAELMQWVLNYTPNEFHLKSESRKAIIEGLIRGRGVLWHELSVRNGQILPRSTFDSVYNLQIDPDADCLETATYAARRRVEPCYQVEDKFGLPRGIMRGNKHSMEASANVASGGEKIEYFAQTGDTYDLCTYWEIYSKSGMGQYFTESEADWSMGHPVDHMRPIMEQFGRNVYFVVSDAVDFPLNLPPHVMEMDISTPEGMEQIKQRLRWPIPFYEDNEGGYGWPFSPLDFHDRPGCVWPRAHMKSGLAELRFLNWGMSFLMGRISTTSKTTIVTADSIEEDLRTALETGEDLEIVSVSKHPGKSVKEMVEVIQFPEVNADLWTTLSAVGEQFDKRVGLTELMYGMGGQRQIRSASEANIRREQVNVRPDDMADKVEDWQSLVSRREAQMLRWFTRGQHVAPILGEQVNPQTGQAGPMSQLWDQMVAVPLDHNNPDTIMKVVQEFSYRIEAGSVRKPNRDRDVANMDAAMQIIFPVLQIHYQQTGDVQTINALMAQWAKVRDLDAREFMLQPPQQLSPEQQHEQQVQQNLMGAMQQILPHLDKYLVETGDPTTVNAMLAQMGQAFGIEVPPLMALPRPDDGELKLLEIDRKGEQDRQTAIVKGQLDIEKEKAKPKPQPARPAAKTGA